MARDCSASAAGSESLDLSVVAIGHRMVSANENIGRYREISTKATKQPMKIMMAGSTSERVAAMRVFTSSSKNSATLFSMAGSAPVDSPTSIMSMAKPGNMFEALREDERA